jgi:hypothetical protein
MAEEEKSEPYVDNRGRVVYPEGFDSRGRMRGHTDEGTKFLKIVIFSVLSCSHLPQWCLN